MIGSPQRKSERMKTLIYYTLAMLLLERTNSQGIGYQCCGLNQMDSSGSVVIETNRPVLPLGSVSAVRIRVCNTNPVAIQLWNCTPDMTSCTFKWQTVVTPTSNQIAADNITVNFDSVTIGPGDRLGLYSQFTSNSPMAIPYGVDSSLAFLYESQQMYTDPSQFTPGMSIIMSSSRWARSFARSIVFCQSRDCVGVSSQALAPVALLRQNPNQPPAGQCCQGQVACDPSTINASTSGQAALIANLTNQVNDLQLKINSFADKSQVITGFCPTGFTPGTYGLGSCYMVYQDAVQYANAIFACRDQKQASLVQIDSPTEETFLSNLVGSGQARKYWTKAMYENGNWYWYDKTAGVRTPITTSYWKDNTMPIPASSDEICSVLVLNGPADSQGHTTYWDKTACASSNMYICETDKICM